jgi:hypothetical protein
MRITQIVQETTTSGSVATVAQPIGNMQKRMGNKKGGSMFAGKTTNKPFYEAEISEQDLILVPGQGRRMKPGFISKAADRTDREVEMALGDLFQAAKNAKMTYDMLKDISEDEGIEGWVQEKIIKASDYLNTIREYLENKRLQHEGTLGAVAGGVAGAYLGKSPSAAMTGANIGSALQDTFAIEGKEELNTKLKEINHKLKMMRGGPVDRPNSMAFVEKRQALMKQKEEILAQLKQGVKEGNNNWGGPLYDPELQGNGKKQKYEMMFKNGQVKRFTAMNDNEARKIAAGHGAKSHIKMKGNVPGDKIKEQDVSEGSEQRKPDLSKIRTHKLEELLALQSEIGRKDPRTKASADLIRAELNKRGVMTAEGAKIDRMVKHIEKSEEKAGKSKEEAERIAWATANKRGMLNNRNKK